MSTFAVSSGTTKSRRTRVTLDSASWMQGERGLWNVKTGDSIARSGREFITNVLFTPGLGYQLRSYDEDLSGYHEGGYGADGVLLASNSLLTVPAGFYESYRQRWHSELTGVGQGSTTTQGDIHIRKNVGAGDNWGSSSLYQLAADSASYPGPDDASAFITMDRVAYSRDVHAPWERVMFRFHWPQPPNAAMQEITRLYFCGPAGADSNGVGIGQYCLKLRGDGIAVLFEKTKTAEWVYRENFEFSKGSGGSRQIGVIRIVTDCLLDDTGFWRGSKIVFILDNVRSIDDAVKLSIAKFGSGRQDAFTYKVPVMKGVTQTTTLARLRLDIRRDVRMSWQLSKARFHASGTLIGDVVSLEHPASGPTSNHISLSWFGIVPTGTSIDGRLYNADTGTALTLDGVAHDIAGIGGYRYFKPDAGLLRIYPVFTLTSDIGGTLTPTLGREHKIRDDDWYDSAPTTTVPTTVESISISGPGSDPSHESARAQITDRVAQLDSILRLRGGMPIKIDTQYDPNDTSKKSVLFQGYVSRAPRKRRGVTRKPGFASPTGMANQLYPHSEWGTYDVIAFGEWTRLSKQQMPRSWDFAFDPTAPKVNGAMQPYKVSDAIRALFLFAGYKSTQVDIPDYPIHLIGPGGGEGLFIEAFSLIGELIVQWARDYLGGYIIFDANADASDPPDASTSRGVWRLKIPPRAQTTGQKYNYLAKFVEKSDGTVTGRVPSIAPEAFPDTTGSSPFGLQTIKQTFMVHGSYMDDVVKPECNIVYVTGVGWAGDRAIGATEAQIGGKVGGQNVQLQAVAINWVSAKFNELQGTAGKPPSPDPTHPDYLGDIHPYYYCDPGLTTQAAVNFAARRIFDLACHAQKWAWFEAPVVLVTDAYDDKQVNPRPLRFGDMVLVKGQPFIVNSVNIQYAGMKGGDRFQHAVYEVFAPPYLQDYTQLGSNYILASGRPAQW